MTLDVESACSSRLPAAGLWAVPLARALDATKLSWPCWVLLTKRMVGSQDSDTALTRMTTGTAAAASRLAAASAITSFSCFRLREPLLIWLYWMVMSRSGTVWVPLVGTGTGSAVPNDSMAAAALLLSDARVATGPVAEGALIAALLSSGARVAANSAVRGVAAAVLVAEVAGSAFAGNGTTGANVASGAGLGSGDEGRSGVGTKDGAAAGPVALLR